MFKLKNIFAVALILTIMSCRKNVEYRNNYITNTVIQTHSWQQDNTFSNEQSYTGIYKTGNGYFASGSINNYFFDTTSLNHWVTLYDGQNYAPFYPRFAVNNKFYSFIYKVNPYTALNFHSLIGYTYGPGYGVPVLDTNIKGYPIYYNVGGFRIPTENIMDASDSNRVIFPIITSTSSVGYAVLDVNFTPNAPPFISKKALHLLNIPSSFGQVVLTENIVICHFGNRFFINTDSNCLIREDLSIKKIDLGNGLFFSNFFKFNNKQYALACGGYSAIFSTIDKGETWNKEFDLNQTLTSLINFDNKLIGLYWDRIFEVLITSNNVSFKEIDNDGLTNKSITGIVKINSDVYIATNGGLFKRPYSNFYTYK